MNYANNTKVKFGCESGYYKTFNKDVDIDDNLEYNLKCVDVSCHCGTVYILSMLKDFIGPAICQHIKSRIV